MAVQPIDLSVMYSQMDNVAKFNASQNQLAQAANQMGRDRAAEESLEKSKTVQNASQKDADSTAIKSDLDREGQSFGSWANEKKEKKEQDEKRSETTEITDPSLGQIIDITG